MNPEETLPMLYQKTGRLLQVVDSAFETLPFLYPEPDMRRQVISPNRTEPHQTAPTFQMTSDDQT